MRILMSVVLLTAALGAMPPVSSAQDSAQALSSEAQRQCDLGRRSGDRNARLAYFERGQQLAEQALELDERIAAAHFALFCNLGEQLRVDGEIEFTSLFVFPRVMGALDRTLELDPNHLDALSSKGTLLVRLPAILGGDPAKGEQMLQQVLQRDPRAINARLALARICLDRGNREEAMLLAMEALKLAEEKRRDDLIPEARAMLAQVR